MKTSFFYTCTIAVGLLFSGIAAAEPVKIPIHNWSSQIVGAYIVGKILSEAGNEVEYVPADSQAVYQAMCEGDVDIVHESVGGGIRRKL